MFLNTYNALYVYRYLPRKFCLSPNASEYSKNNTMLIWLLPHQHEENDWIVICLNVFMVRYNLQEKGITFTQLL